MHLKHSAAQHTEVLPDRVRIVGVLKKEIELYASPSFCADDLQRSHRRLRGCQRRGESGLGSGRDAGYAGDVASATGMLKSSKFVSCVPVVISARPNSGNLGRRDVTDVACDSRPLLLVDPVTISQDFSSLSN